MSSPISLFVLGGDTMLGRAVQMTCWHQCPGEGEVMDSCTAEYYLREALHVGQNPDEAAFEKKINTLRYENRSGKYVWGDLLGLEFDEPPDLRLLNLETVVTASIDTPDRPQPHEKGITYHFHSTNLAGVFGALAAAHGSKEDGPIPYVVSFANNHMMDFGREAFDRDSIPAFASLPGKGHLVGAGRSIAEAARAVTVSTRQAGVEVRVVAAATLCAGTMPDWEAGPARSGLVLLPEVVSERRLEACKAILRRWFGSAKPTNSADGSRTILVLSIHWGPNWAFRSSRDEQDQAFRRRLAHWVVDELGVDLVYGHSSHHIREMELYQGKLIIYGAGDLLNDYEGFENRGDQHYSKLGGAFLVDLEPSNGNLRDLRIVPTFVNELRICRWVPGAKVWSAIRKRMESRDDAVEELAAKINGYGQRMPPMPHSQPVALRVLQEDARIPGGPVLKFKPHR